MKELKNLRDILTRQQVEDLSRLIEHGNREPGVILGFLDEGIPFLRYMKLSQRRKSSEAGWAMDVTKAVT